MLADTTEDDDQQQTLCSKLSSASLLYRIITTTDVIRVTEGAHISVSLAIVLQLAEIIDNCLAIVPQSIIKSSINTLIRYVATQLQIEMPRNVGSIDAARGTIIEQAQTCCLDLLTSPLSLIPPNQRLNMLQLPARHFRATAYIEAQRVFGFSDGYMAALFLGALLQTAIREEPSFMTNVLRPTTTLSCPPPPPPLTTPPPTTTTTSLAKQKKLATRDTHCRKCLMSSLLLASFEQKRLNPTYLQMENCSKLNTFIGTIPAQLRASVQDIYTKITMGLPLHTIEQPCPLSRNERQREAFLSSCSNPLGSNQRQVLLTNFVKAYKSHQICFGCGAPRPARVSKMGKAHNCTTHRFSTSSSHHYLRDEVDI